MENQDLKAVYQSLCQRDLTEAMSNMDIFLSKYRSQVDADILNAIRTDFQLMSDYWKRGYKDPLLPSLYQTLLRRMYMLYANVALSREIGESSFFSTIYMRLHISANDWSLDLLRSNLESFVSETALLELEQEHKQAAKSKEIHARHHQMMSEWFDYLLLSPCWTDGQASVMEDILLSPTIESRDQQILITGLTLALIRAFDAPKFRTLVHVYRQSADEQVRQRALVGWVMGLGDEISRCLFPEEVRLVESLLEDKAVCQELVQLQQQLVFCINAEKDNETIQKEIMPDILDKNRFRLTRNGLEEIEENPLNDILHPDEEERRLEQMEESIQRMQAMHDQGSDIYFSGFSQMKRFPFFQEMVNWFVPFYQEHPGIVEITDQFRQNKFLAYLMKLGTFCNSDRYSFVLAYSQVILRLPQNLRDLMESGEAQFLVTPTGEDMQQAVYCRRNYLQDLYRFYRLFPQRASFKNPFEQQTFLFFANPIFRQTHLEPHFSDIAAFLLKQHRLEAAADVLQNCGEARRDFRYYMMAGYLSSKCKEACRFDDEGAVGCYRRALQFQPDHEKALQGYARALFNQDDYEEALEVYDKLLTIRPDDRICLLNRAVCLTRMGRYQQAQIDLFRLNFENPDDQAVNKVLAWALTCDGKYEQAIKLYGQLISDDMQHEDMLNYGYCLWLSGHVDDAVDCFHRYLKETGLPATAILDYERQLLEEKGITEPELQMMRYLL